MIIDSHTHIFPERVADRAMEVLRERYQAHPVARPTPDGLRRHMDECGVDRAVVVAIATKPEQVASINQWLGGLGDERFIPFGSLHPHVPDLAGEVQRLVDLGFRGIKLHAHFQDLRLGDPQFVAMLELVGERLLVLMHAGDDIMPVPRVEPTPARLLRLHQRLPQVRFIFAHLGSYRQWDEVEELLVGQDVLLDASYVFDECSDEQIERLIRRHGTQRVVWGSDYPWQTEAQGLAGVARLALSDQERRDLLAGNLLRVLGEAEQGEGL